jgi:DNA-binding NtrC family response regulator
MESLPLRAEKPAALRVLVVDDEALIRWSLAAILQDAGHAVIEAADAAETVKYLFEGPDPDVIFLDCRLPDSQDLTLLETIRRLVPKTPVIMMTADAHPEMIWGAERLGACRVVCKPFDMGIVLSLVRQARSSLTDRASCAAPGFPRSSVIIH